jgi:hypothetical protein
MRVFLSSLRCFFFAIRFRRFLMTEPTSDLSSCTSVHRMMHFYSDACVLRCVCEADFSPRQTRVDQPGNSIC